MWLKQGNSNSIHKLLRVQKRAIRVIHNTKYRHHTDPLFKRKNIVKVSDIYQLQVFSFMHDLVNNMLPDSFDDFIPITNESNYDITTRQRNRLYITRPRTTVSSNLPNHNFANIWNEFDQIYQKCKPKNKAKKLLCWDSSMIRRHTRTSKRQENVAGLVLALSWGFCFNMRFDFSFKWWVSIEEIQILFADKWKLVLINQMCIYQCTDHTPKQFNDW